MGESYPVTIGHAGYTLTTDRSQMQVQRVHQWLSTQSYWAKDIPYEVFRTAHDHSFPIAILINGRQVGYGRLITDYATFGYLADIYVEEVHRGKGLSKAMMNVLLELDWVKGLRRIYLRTKDAHGLYARFGFTASKFPERMMGKGGDKSGVNGSEHAEDLHREDAINHFFGSAGTVYVITTEKSRMKVHDIHRWISQESYWSKNIPFETFRISFENSFCIGILAADRQVGFARLLSDRTGFGYLADVYVEEAHRGRGLSKEMLGRLLSIGWVKRLSINLVTKDAQDLYGKFGFSVCNPERVMEITRPGIYENMRASN